MTSKELINGVFSDLHEETGEYFATGTLAAGGSNTNFKITALSTVPNDFLNGKEIYLVDGNNAGMRREIVDWDMATTTGIVNPAFPASMASGVAFVIGEKGFSSHQEILSWANDGAKKIVSLLDTEALWDYRVNTTAVGVATGGSGYGTIIPPTNMHKKPGAIQIDANPAVILEQDELQRLLNDPFTPYAIIWRSKTLMWFKPDGTPTITFNHPPIPAAITVSVDPDLPSRVHPLLRAYCAWQALLKKERIDLAARKEADFVAMVKAFNEMRP